MRCGPPHIAFVIGLVTANSAAAQIAVTSPTMVERTVQPGDVYRDTITIHNSSRAIQAVSLTLADYRFSASGATVFDPPGTESRSNVAWIGLGQTAVSVPPHGDIAVSYRVTVPRSTPAPEGTYWSVVLVQAARTEPLPETGFGIVPTLRYAIQMATHVGRSGEARLAFSEPRLMRTGLGVAIDSAPEIRDDSFVLGSDAILALDMTDVGTRACRPALRLEIYRADGRLAHSATVQRGLLYPGSSIRQVFTLPPLASGDYVALLLVDVGAARVQGTRFPLHVP